jgi:hypothetical protein
MKRRYYFSTLTLFAATALWAAGEPTAEELEQNQRRVEALRKQPDLIARLRENLQAFEKLKDKKKHAVLQLDQDLHELAANKQARYWNVLERYADWLEHLRKEDLQLIKDAPDAAARLAVIKDLRDREWMQGQPKAYRLEWEKLQGEARGQFVAKLRLDERQKHQRWVISQRFWKELESQKTLPCRLSDFAVEVKGKVKDKEAPKTVNKVEIYVNDYLKPYMTAQEEEQLKEAEGRWPDYPVVLVEIASRRTPALPPQTKELRKFDDLPRPIKKALTEIKGKESKKAAKSFHQLDGSSDFARRLVELAANPKDNKLPFEHEYLASNPASLQKPMKKFWDEDLVPAVKKDNDDLRKLTSSEGKWPDFPLAIQELARKHSLTPPWHILPDPDKWHWDRYRTRNQGSGVRGQESGVKHTDP